MAENEEFDKEMTRNENTELLIEIAHLCNRKDRKGVENIFLLGRCGAGKSALVNTVIKAIAGKYIPKAKVGVGVAQAKTLTLQRFKSCGVNKEDILDGTQRDLILRTLPKLPTILDASGRGDINTESLQEILELVIRGCVQPGTSIGELEHMQEKYYVGALKEIFKESRPEWKVTKIAFVQSWRDAVPKNLVKCLHTVINSIDPATAQPIFTGDVFVVITKYDLVCDQSRNGSRSKDEMERMETFEERENELADVFNIHGALEDNRIRWVSYTDSGSTDNPYIDNIALKFIRRMVMPGSPQIEEVTPVVTPAVSRKLRAKKWLKRPSIFFLYFLIFGIVLAVVLFKLFTTPL